MLIEITVINDIQVLIATAERICAVSNLGVAVVEVVIVVARVVVVRSVLYVTYFVVEYPLMIQRV